MPLMPWQRLIADVGGEMLEDGTPAYRDVIFTVPRQSGKTVLVLAWECQRAIGFQHLGPQAIAYTAQDGTSARKKLLQDQAPLLERHKKLLGIKQIYRGTGPFEGVIWHNGSRLSVLASTEEAGHGQTLDLAVKDEFWKDEDDRRDQALRPAMVTRAHAQVITCSTMGTETSVPLNRLIDRGRAAAEAGRTEGIAYFEWSAPDDADPGDPATWWGCMPALGHEVRESTIHGEWEALKDTENEFRRAYLNQQTKADDRVISRQKWTAVCDDAAVPGDDAVIAIDVEPNRAFASIGAASNDDGLVVALIDHRPGVGWLVDRAAEIALRRNVSVVIDMTGPAGNFIEPLRGRGCRVVEATRADLVRASTQFFDTVMAGDVEVRTNERLDEAVAAAVKLSAGDSWRWGRKSTQADVSPLVAVTLAAWGAQQPSSGGGWMVSLP